MAKNKLTAPTIPANFSGHIYTGPNFWSGSRVQKPGNKKKTMKKAKKTADTPRGKPQKKATSPGPPAPPDPSAASAAATAALAVAALTAPAPPTSTTPPPPKKGSDDPAKKDLEMGDEGGVEVSGQTARNRVKKALQKERRQRKKLELSRELNDLKRFKADMEKSLEQS